MSSQWLVCWYVASLYLASLEASLEISRESGHLDEGNDLTPQDSKDAAQIGLHSLAMDDVFNMFQPS